MPRSRMNEEMPPRVPLDASVTAVTTKVSA
jgi:hypothetical protein